MTDTEIQTRIREDFLNVIENPALKQFKLSFTISGKTFTTVLKIKCEVLPDNKFKLLRIETKSDRKDCIEIIIAIPIINENNPLQQLEDYQESGYAEFLSMIQANSPTQKCFDPVLTSNRNNPDPTARYTSTDVLQILKTKLQLLIPLPLQVPIQIMDAATIQNVSMTPFNILHGKDPFYKKYGYVYKNLQPILDYLPTVQWGSVKNGVYKSHIWTNNLRDPFSKGVVIKISEAIQSITGKEYDDDEYLLTIMKDVSFEEESKLNTATITRYTPSILNAMISPFHLSKQIIKAVIESNSTLEKDFIIAILDPDSAEWKRSSDRLQFTAFEPVAAGGRRKTYRRKQKRNKKSRRKN